MASYLEIQSLEESPTAAPLRNRIKVALSKSAQEILELPAATPEQRAVAAEILDNPARYELRALRFLAAKFGIVPPPGTALTLTQLINADDASVQSGVRTVTQAFIGVSA